MGFFTDTKFGIILGLKKSDFFIENDFFCTPLVFNQLHQPTENQWFIFIKKSKPIHF